MPDTEARLGFPWRNIFRLAMARGIAPDHLWQMTPAELSSLLDVPQHHYGDGEDNMTRELLATLIQSDGGSAILPSDAELSEAGPSDHESAHA